MIAIAKRRATVKREATETKVYTTLSHTQKSSRSRTSYYSLSTPGTFCHGKSSPKLSPNAAVAAPLEGWRQILPEPGRAPEIVASGLGFIACRQPRALQNRAPGPHWNNSRRRQSQPHQYLPKPLTSIESPTDLEAREVDSLWSRWLCGHGLEYRAIGQCPPVHSFPSHQGLVRSFGCRHQR